MLTVDDFNLLPDNEKAEIAWLGTFLTEREEDDHILQLYSLPDLLV